MKKVISILLCAVIIMSVAPISAFAEDVESEALFGRQYLSEKFAKPGIQIEVTNPFYLIPSVIVSVVTMMPYYLTVGFLTLISPFVLVFGFVESTIYHRNPDLYQKLVDLGIFDPVIESSNIVV